MSKGITKADNCSFHLSNDLKEISENELRETNATRTFALNALREWLESNQRISAVRMGKQPKNEKKNVTGEMLAREYVSNICEQTICKI